MSGYLREEQLDESKLSTCARKFLTGLREGMSESEAAARAGVPVADLRRWKREETFRDAIHRAPTERGPKIWVDAPTERGAIPPPTASAAEIDRAGFRRVK